MKTRSIKLVEQYMQELHQIKHSGEEDSFFTQSSGDADEYTNGEMASYFKKLRVRQGI
jgi:hypothetical protein